MTHSLLRAAVGCAALIAASGAVSAADMYRKAPPATPIAAPVSVYNWTGFYLGANLGAEMLSDKVDVAAGSGSLKPNAVFGGIQGGYNFQTGPWVVGVEADLGYGRPTKSGTFAGQAERVEKGVSGTVRARVGHAFDRLLVYGTGGLAVANVKVSDDASSRTATKAGWTLGAGAEYAVTQNVSVKGEYLYADYGKINVGASSHAISEHLLRVGANYKF
ncbi:MAG: outer membrane protein [Siculibacillus sp.]